jgi:hypothetical protein
LNFHGDNAEGWLISNKELKLTPTTANKLSEAISVVVEYITESDNLSDYESNGKYRDIGKKIEAARESYLESQ